ncbi:MAG: biotin transporter BioY [Hyphomicrobiales bacterium]
MTTSTGTFPTLSHAIWPQSNLVRSVILAVIGSIAMWVSAKVQIPFYPVPMTMQTFVAISLGVAFGWRLGAAAVMLYLLEGAAGLPVFAGTPDKGIGLAYMMGPTGGYLIGFVLTAGVAGWLAERGFDRNAFTMFVAMLLGAAAIYIPGLAWLSSLIGFEKAIQFGLTPFVLADVTKAALGAALFPAIWALLGKRA